MIFKLRCILSYMFQKIGYLFLPKTRDTRNATLNLRKALDQTKGL